MDNARNKGEVDLMEVFLKIFSAVRANFWLIGLSFIVGTALGLAYYFSSDKVYESKMVVSSAILTSSFSEALVDKLNRHRRELNSKAIQGLLNCDIKTAKSLVKLEIDKMSQVDDLKEADKFTVTALVLDQDALPDLERGLVFYLENNEYVKVRVAQNKKYLQQMISKLDAEIKDMEEFKQKLTNGSFFETARGNVMFDPTTVNSKILDLTKERINLQNSLDLSNSVQVIEGFTRFERPSSPRLLVSLISGSFVGLFFVGLFIAFKSIRKVLRMADAAKQKA
jgi:hypothetical protein